MIAIEQKIVDISKEYSRRLSEKIESRLTELQSDDTSHYMIFSLLGIDEKESEAIDKYQNMGRFVYRYAGSFLENVVLLCFESVYPEIETPFKINNSLSSKPRKFSIDFRLGDRLYEIKWRDATTDGDHVVKEHTKARSCKEAGFIPVRLMFFYPNRKQAIIIQDTIKSLYKGLDGECYFGKDAWDHVYHKTDIDLLEILRNIAERRAG